VCSPTNKGHEDFTSSSTSLFFSNIFKKTEKKTKRNHNVFFNCFSRGLRSLQELTKHLTTRAYDIHAAHENENTNLFSSKISQRPFPEKTKRKFLVSLKLVRFRALFRIKPHAPPLLYLSVNFLDFQSCDRTLQVEYLTC
jgi:hypothetical protein